MKAFFQQVSTISNAAITRMNDSAVKVENATKLANEYGVNLIRGEFAVGCPGVMNPLETVGIVPSWGYGTNNADRTDRFNQFEMALKAVDAAVKRTHTDIAEISFQECKNLFVQLNVYGRAMFMHIVKQSSKIDIDARTSVLMDVAKYATEGLDFNGTCNKNNVGIVYKAHIAPKIDEYIASLRKEEEIKHFEAAENKSLEVLKEKTSETLTKEPKNALEIYKEKLENLEIFKHSVKVGLKYINYVDYYYISGDALAVCDDFAEDNNLEGTQLFKNFVNMCVWGDDPVHNMLKISTKREMPRIKKEANNEVIKLKDIPLFNTLLNTAEVNNNLEDKKAQIEVEITTAPEKTLEEDPKEEVLELVKSLIEENVTTEEFTGAKIITSSAFNWIHEIVGENNLESPEFDLLTSQVADKTLSIISGDISHTD